MREKDCRHPQPDRLLQAGAAGQRRFCVFMFYASAMMNAANLLLLGWAVFVGPRAAPRRAVDAGAGALQHAAEPLYSVQPASALINLPNNLLRNLQMVGNLAAVLYGVRSTKAVRRGEPGAVQGLTRLLVGSTFFLSAATLILYFLISILCTSPAVTAGLLQPQPCRDSPPTSA